MTDDHQIQSIGLTERTTYNVGRVGDASPNTASAVLCNPAKNGLLSNSRFSHPEGRTQTKPDEWVSGNSVPYLSRVCQSVFHNIFTQKNNSCDIMVVGTSR